MPKLPRLDSPAGFWLFVLGALALLGLNLDFALWEPWEGKNAQTAVEMVQRGDLLTPFFRDDPRFSKPPLMYWLMAPAYALFGLNELALRLPFVLIAVAGLGSFVYALRRLFGTSAAYLSALVLLTSPMFFFLSRQLMVDVLLVSFLMAASGLTALALFRDERRTLHMALAYIAAAGAVLSKGPLAVFLIVGTLGLCAVGMLAAHPASLRTPIATAKDVVIDRLKLHWGLALLLALTLPWYVYNALNYEIFLERLRFDYLDRIATPEGNHDGSPFYYIEAVSYGMFPWICLVPAAFVALGARLKETWRTEPGPLLFLLAWVVVPFALFTASETKFTYYIAPALPPLAALVGLLLQRYLEGRDRQVWIAGLSLVSLGLLVTPAWELVQDARELVGSFTIKISVSGPIDADPAVGSPSNAILSVSMLFAVILLSAAMLRELRWRRPLVVGLAVVTLGSATYLAQGLIVALSPHKSQKWTTQYVLSQPDAHGPVCIASPGAGVRQHLEWAAIESTTIFYANNDVLELTSVDDVAQYFIENPDAYCVLRTRFVGAVRAELRAEAYMGLQVVEDSHYRFHVVRATPLP